MKDQYVKYLLLLFVVAVPIILFIYPLFVVWVNSFFVDGNLSLDNYVRFFSSRMYLQSLKNSLFIASMSTVIIAPLGLLIVESTRKHQRIKKILKLLTSLPLVFPSYVFCIALIYIYGRTGMFNYVLSLISIELPISNILYSIMGIVFANVLFFLPFFIIPLFASFEELDPFMEEAAEGLGSRGFFKFRTIIFPQIAHSFLTGVLITFLLIFNQISVVIALGAGRTYTLTYQLFVQYEGFHFDMAYTLAVIIMCITGLVALIFQIILRHVWVK